MRNMETPFGSVLGWRGRPIRKRGGIPGRDRMPSKQTPVAERQQESKASVPGSSAGWLCITGRIPGLVPGRESALTWAGEPLKTSRS